MSYSDIVYSCKKLARHILALMMLLQLALVLVLYRIM